MLKHILIYAPARIVPTAAGLLSLSIFTRVLKPEQYGYYALAISVGVTLDGFFGQWLQGGIMRFHAAQKHGADVNRLLASCGLLYLAPSLIVCAVGALILLGFWQPGEEQAALLLALPYFFVYSLQHLVLSVHGAAIRSLRYSILNMSQAGLSAGIAIGLITLLHPSPAMGLAGVVTGFVIVLLIDWRTTRLLFSLSRARRKSMIEVARFAWPTTISSGLALATARLNRFILMAIAGAGAVGLFNAALVLSEQAIFSVFLIIASAAYPITIKAQERETEAALQDRLRSNAIWIFGLGLPGAAGLAAVSSEIAALFLGEAYREAAAALTPLLAAITFLAGVRGHFVIHSYFLAQKLHFNLYLSIYALAVTAAGNFLLVPIYGMPGAVAAMAITEATTLAFAYILTFYAVRLPLPFMELGKIAIATAIMTGALRLIPALHPLASLALKLFFGVGVYAAAVLILDIDGLTRKLLDKRRPSSQVPIAEEAIDEHR
jgi:O-antigen/teichoic acid export membrane protein